MTDRTYHWILVRRNESGNPIDHLVARYSRDVDDEEFEVWVHIDGEDHGFIHEQSEDDVDPNDVAQIKQGCALSSRNEAQLTIITGSSGAGWVLQFRDARLPLNLRERRLEFEDIYRESMVLIGGATKSFEEKLRQSQQDAVAVVNQSRSVIIEELNKRNAKLRELEQELHQLRKKLHAYGMESIEASPVKKEAESKGLPQESEGVVPSQMFPFMGINASRPSVSPQKGLRETASEPLLPNAATSRDIDEEDDDTDVTDTDT